MAGPFSKLPLSLPCPKPSELDAVAVVMCAQTIPLNVCGLPIVNVDAPTPRRQVVRTRRSGASKQQPHRDVENGRRDDVRPRSVTYPNISPNRQGLWTPFLGSLASSPDLEQMAMHWRPLSHPSHERPYQSSDGFSAGTPGCACLRAARVVSNDPIFAEQKDAAADCHRRSPPPP